ncbi:YoaK family protein [Coralloluteibacterium thermophilus]|uniref:YoaK family protein n=1 Tax=Coralloluteibacterium thermophilum TaxID=2707049 RepID=A0ABV9NLC5_9GAMM
MISRLPTWVWIGAGTLALVAGMVNVVGLIGFEHQGLSHLSGTTSQLGEALAQGSGRAALQLLLVLAAFVAGALLSGLLIGGAALQLGRPYGAALSIEAGLLALAVPLFEHHHMGGALVAAMACGLQNALTTTYSGALIRTTHVTGMFTDLGMFLGNRLRGLPVDGRRIALCLLVATGFLCGGVLGALLFPHLGYRTLWLPALLTGSAGVAYVVYDLRRRTTTNTKR